MKRRSMGSDQPPPVSESLAYICSLLSPFGLDHLSPQSLLLAAANDPAASASMWSSLHQIICLQVASPSSSRPVENVLLCREEVDTCSESTTDFVKFYLSLWGFSHTSPVFSLSYNTEESQYLLIALAWLVSRCDIFRRALKARIKKLSPHLSPPTPTPIDVSETSAALERARAGRARGEDYVDKLILASDKITDDGVRARARSQQLLMLFGRVRMSIMTLHSLLSTKAKLMHNLNQIQLDFKIKNQEGYPHSQFDIHILEHREALEKHFGALAAVKHIGEEMARCEKHEKTFWQWMVAVILNPKVRRLTARAPSAKYPVVLEFCTVYITPVVENLKHQLKANRRTTLPGDSAPVEPLDEDPVANLKHLSIPDKDIDEVRRLYEKTLFRSQRAKFVYECAATSSRQSTTTNSDAKAVVERLKVFATASVQALAQTRVKNRIYLEGAMDRYVSEGYVLHNF